MSSRQESEFILWGFLDRRLRSGFLIGMVILMLSVIYFQDRKIDRLRDQLIAAKEQNTTITEKLLREQLQSANRLDTLVSRQLRIYEDLRHAKEEIATLKRRKR